MNIVTAVSGISPAFPITAEEFRTWYTQAVTRTSINGVQPPILNGATGLSQAMLLFNQWFPWIDEQLVEVKYDGVCQYLGTPSNGPTLMRDYHIIALMRAVDYIFSPQYIATITASVGSVGPAGPPLPAGGG